MTSSYGGLSKVTAHQRFLGISSVLRLLVMGQMCQALTLWSISLSALDVKAMMPDHVSVLLLYGAFRLLPILIEF